VWQESPLQKSDQNQLLMAQIQIVAIKPLLHIYNKPIISRNEKQRRDTYLISKLAKPAPGQARVPMPNGVKYFNKLNKESASLQYHRNINYTFHSPVSGNVLRQTCLDCPIQQGHDKQHRNWQIRVSVTNMDQFWHNKHSL
jgi:hypothetical protein